MGTIYAQTNKNADALIAADKSFAALSMEKGMKEAFLSYVSDEVLIYRDGPGIVYGRSELIQHYQNVDDSGFDFNWFPEGGRIASSGEIGYTWGEYLIQSKESKETLGKGKYLSVWQLIEGKWKLAADCGADIKID